MFLSVYINIQLLIHNSLKLYFPIKNLSSYLANYQLSAIYLIFSLVPRKDFSSQQKQFNVNYSHSRVFICSSDFQETKSNKCSQIEVLLQRDYRLKVLTEYSNITMVS